MDRSLIHDDDPILDPIVALKRTGKFQTSAMMRFRMRVMMRSAQISRCSATQVVASRTPCGCGVSASGCTCCAGMNVGGVLDLDLLLDLAVDGGIADEVLERF